MSQYPLVLMPFDEDEKGLLRAAIDRGQFTMSHEVKTFEAQFAQTVGSRFAVMVNSGSSANLMGICALLYADGGRLKRGDEVIVPAIGWATTWAPLQQMGLTIRVVDVNLETLNMDVDEIMSAVTPSTKMILTVSVLGNPLEFERLKQFCNERQIILFEDNCESLGATVSGKWLGTFGLIGTFSFYYSHHISTIEGGMLVTNDEELYNLCLSLRAHGWTRDLPDQTPNGFKEQYRFLVPGFNLRPLEFSGILGQSQLKKLPRILEQRRKNAREFADLMQEHPNIQTQQCRYGDSSWYAFTMILKDRLTEDRDRLFSTFQKHGIESRMITGGNLLQHKMAKYFDMTLSSDLTNSQKAHNQGLFVANHGVPMTKMFNVLHRALQEFGL